MKFTHSEVVSHFKEETTQKNFQKREDDSGKKGYREFQVI